MIPTSQFNALITGLCRRDQGAYQRIEQAILQQKPPPEPCAPEFKLPPRKPRPLPAMAEEEFEFECGMAVA